VLCPDSASAAARNLVAKHAEGFSREIRERTRKKSQKLLPAKYAKGREKKAKNFGPRNTRKDAKKIQKLLPANNANIANEEHSY
jgi:hypothetical protein